MNGRRLLSFFSVILFAWWLSIPASAHPGRTDSQGGHYDRSTGEYHYHHGHPAHQHTDLDGDGIADCPYDFEDLTDHASGSSGSVSEKTIPFEFESPGYIDDFAVLPSATTLGTEGTEPSTVFTETEASDAVPEWVYWTFAVLTVLLAFKWLQVRGEKSENSRLQATIQSLHSDLDDLHKENDSLDNDTSQLNQQILSMEKDRELLEDVHSKDIDSLQQQLILLKTSQDSKQAYVAAHICALCANMEQQFSSAYLYVMANAPQGDYLDEAMLPYGSDAVLSLWGNQWGAKYTFYVSGDSKKTILTYHTRRCSHGSRCTSLRPVNAYTIQQQPWHYQRCRVCQPKLPDVTWVDRYKDLKSFIEEYTENSEKESGGTQA